MSPAPRADGIAPVRTGARVEARELSWRPYGRALPVLTGLTFRIEPGERVLLAGPSGSGKSTLLRALAGVLTTVESGNLGGYVTLDDAEAPSRGVPVGLLMQDPSDAMVARRVGREVAFGPENLGLSRDRIWAAVREALDAVGFPYGLEHPVDAVSGGEAQRLALAGVLALGPRLILLDEPTAMLDPAAAAVVREAIWAAGLASGATMIVVEHQLDGWLPGVDRAIVLDDGGAISADGPVEATLREQAASLSGLGVWVPGLPSPRPREIPRELCTPHDGAAASGTVLLTASAVGLVRARRRGLGADLEEQGPDAVAALSGVDLLARAGEVLAIVGASGAGKSTLTALMAGLESPTSGEVTATRELRRDATPQPARWTSRELARRVGWVPQQAELAVVARTVRDDVLATARLLDRDERAAEQRTDGLLAALGLSALRDADPHTLSGGELRRLALAGAIAHGPAVLVLDEPTVGQDRNTWAAVAGVILAARDAGVAVVVATHDPLLIALADRHVRLERGRLVDDGAAPGALASTTIDAPVPENAPRRWSGLAMRAGPLSLLGSSLLLLAGASSITELPVAAAAVAVEVALAPVVFGWRRVPRRLLPGLLAVTSVGFSSWLLGSGQDLGVAVTAGLRVAFFVLPGVMMAGLVDPFALGDHLAQRLRLPARPVVAAVAALGRFETLGDAWHQLSRIRRVRGLGAGRSPLARGRECAALTFGLLIQSLRQAGRMAVAMEARGFSQARSGAPRSWAEPAPWRRADSALMFLGVLVALVPPLLAQVIR